MSRLCRASFPLLALAAAAAAQGPEFLFSTTLPEVTLSGSGGTSLRFLKPNEMALMQTCPPNTEKWAPRTCFQTMAGDENGNGAFWEPALFGQIDAITCVFGASGAAGTTQRDVFWSPSAAMGTTVSGAPGLRPGDVGRIVRNGSGDGQVEYFIRAEQIQIAMGLPPTPVVVNIDGIASNPNYGVLFSLETDINATLCTGPAFVRDGDVLMIPASQLTWSPSMTVLSVNPNSAAVVYTEAMMDTIVANANITDRFGLCVNQVVDTDDFEIDWQAGPSSVVVMCSGLVAPVPNLVFAAETLTGGGLVTTAGGGTIYSSPCNVYGTPCGMGPTLGVQIGLRPPTAAVGIPSSICGLAATRAFLFVSEAPAPVLTAPVPVTIDFASPGPLTWVFLTFAPTGPGVVAPSASLPPAFLGFPDFYPMPTFAGVVPTGTGFGTYTSPVVPWPCKLIFQGITFNTAGTLMASTPSTVEIY